MTLKQPKLRIGYSPCPNDTYQFYALTHHQQEQSEFSLQVEHHGIHTLNQLALAGDLEIVKVSAAHYLNLESTYAPLPVGSAFGKAFGPLVLVRNTAPAQMETWKVGIPGKHTTAALLTRLWNPNLQHFYEYPFHQILSRLQDGTLDAGVIIHESRFHFEHYDVTCIQDLGQWWDQTYQLPLPLGILCTKHSIPSMVEEKIISAIQQSIAFAEQHTDQVMRYILSHSQESNPEMVRQHIHLYVNEFSKDWGTLGKKAFETFLQAVRSLS